MEEEKLISVVIPMYNVENYIKYTLESVLNQTYKNIEIVVVDDGSRDKSGVIVKKLCENHKEIKYIYQENSGVSAARNKAMLNSSGEYIAFLDGDDFWEKTKLEKQIKEIEKKNMDGCYCGTIDYYEDRNYYVNEKIKFREGNILIPYLKGDTWPQTCTWLIKKEVIEKNKITFDESSSWGEDFEFFIKVAALAKICAVKEFLFTYRKREGSLSKFSFAQLKEIDCWNRLRRWLEECYCGRVEKKKAIELIENYRIPGAAIRVVFEGMYSERDIGELNEYKSIYNVDEYIANFNMFIGNTQDGLRLSLFKISIGNPLVMSKVKLIRNVKRKIKK